RGCDRSSARLSADHARPRRRTGAPSPRPRKRPRQSAGPSVETCCWFPAPPIQQMLRPQNGGTMEMLWLLMPAAIDRRWLREEAFQDVIADRVVLLVERCMRDSRHHRELLVRVWQQFEEFAVNWAPVAAAELG